MGSIEWIADGGRRYGADAFTKMVDQETAINIAKESTINISNPAERVPDFIADLPNLYYWFSENHRDFPWRRTRDPWSVIVAEILLQRTHATKTEEVYRIFIDRYPNPDSVYRAGKKEILDVVGTLGFGNKRTATLRRLAEALIEEHNGEVPNDLETLMKLPRIGRYTARASLCFAFGEPLAIVDANIKVVVEDVFGYDSSRRAHKDESLYAFLDALIPDEPDAARIFNLALLDLRDAVCEDEDMHSICPFDTSCIKRNQTN